MSLKLYCKVFADITFSQDYVFLNSIQVNSTFHIHVNTIKCCTVLFRDTMHTMQYIQHIPYIYVFLYHTTYLNIPRVGAVAC